MLYSKRRKNLKRGIRKRSTHKSYRSYHSNRLHMRGGEISTVRHNMRRGVTGLVLDNDGQMIISSSAADGSRVDRYSLDTGALIFENNIWGGLGFGKPDYEWGSPRGLAILNNKLIITDSINHRLVIYNYDTLLNNYTYITEFKKPNGIQRPNDLIIVDDQIVLHDEECIHVFNLQLDEKKIDIVRTFGKENITGDGYLAFCGDLLYVTDSTNEIKVFNYSSGTINNQFKITAYDDLMTQNKYSSKIQYKGIVCMDKDKLIIGDYGNGRVLVIEYKDNKVWELIHTIKLTYRSSPNKIIIDKTGKIIVGLYAGDAIDVITM